MFELNGCKFRICATWEDLELVFEYGTRLSGDRGYLKDFKTTSESNEE